MASNGDTIDTIHLCNKIPKIPKMDTKISSIPHQSFASGVAILKPWIYSVGSIESKVNALRQETSFAKEQTIRHQTTAMEALNRELKDWLMGEEIFVGYREVLSRNMKLFE